MPVSLMTLMSLFPYELRIQGDERVYRTGGKCLIRLISLIDPMAEHGGSGRRCDDSVMKNKTATRVSGRKC